MRIFCVQLFWGGFPPTELAAYPFYALLSSLSQNPLTQRLAVIIYAALFTGINTSILILCAPNKKLIFLAAGTIIQGIGLATKLYFFANIYECQSALYDAYPYASFGIEKLFRGIDNGCLILSGAGAGTLLSAITIFSAIMSSEKLKNYMKI